MGIYPLFILTPYPSSVTGTEAAFVVNTDIYAKEKMIPASSNKSGPVIAKREVKKVSSTTYCICLFSDLRG